MSLIEKLKIAEQVEMIGWDFSRIEGRMKEFPLSWHYPNLLKPYLKNSQALLDMGTGGGEFLSSLEDLPAFTCATEGYPPNLEIAKKHLEPLGIKVFEVQHDLHLPFEDQTFDVIMNRHESFEESEIKRLLKPGGIFITQQVGGLNDSDLNEAMYASPSPYLHWNLETAIHDFVLDGFEIIAKQEEFTKTRFYDLEALVFYLKCIPWQIEDFSVERYQDELIILNEWFIKQGYFDTICHRFFFIVCKIR